MSVIWVQQASAQTVAATPPMGWNSWNHFHRTIDDKTVRAQADAMVSSGMRDAGYIYIYIYINIDDTWEGERDAQGFIHPNSKFPDMKALADYVHGKGLKLGDLLFARRKDVRRIRRQSGARAAGCGY